MNRTDFLDEMAHMANLQSLCEHDHAAMTALDQQMLKAMEDEEQRFFLSMSDPLEPTTQRHHR